MELKHYFLVLWKWSWLIALATFIGAGASLWATSRMPREYVASTTLMVGRFIQAADPTGQDLAISQQLADSYAQMVRLEPILQGTIDTLGLDMNWRALVGQVYASHTPGTQLIQIAVRSTDPQQAKILADEIARQLIRQSPTSAEQEQTQHREFVGQQLELLQAQIEEAEKQVDDLEGRLALENSARGIQDLRSQADAARQKITVWRADYAKLLDFFEGNRTNYLSVVEPANIPTIPVSPNVMYFVLMAAATGLVLATTAAFLLDYLDDTLKSKEDVERVLKLPTLGKVTRISSIHTPSDNLVTLQNEYSQSSDAYRVLRTNIQFYNLNNPSFWLLVSSAIPGEGKTTTACNLAITMAYAGKRVILIDGDLHRPMVHRYFEIPNQIGLTNLLLDNGLSIGETLVETSIGTLKVLPSGPLPPSPADLLASEPMKQRLQQIRALADVVIFDSPPVLGVADAAILASLCNGVIMVVNAGHTHSQTVRQAKETLTQLNLKVFGVVLNKLKSRQANDYAYYHYYSNVQSNRRGKPRWWSRFTKAPQLIGLGRGQHPVNGKFSTNGHTPVELILEDEEKI